MIKINLLPREIGAKAVAREKTVVFVSIIGIFVAVIVVALGAQLSRVHKLEARSKELSQQIADLQAVVAKVKDIKKKEDLLRKELELIQGLTKYRVAYPKLLEILTRRLPGKVWLTNFTTKSAGEGGSPAKIEVKLNGVSFNNFAIADFITALQQIKGMSGVELQQISESGIEGGQRGLVFAITCKYSSPG